MVDLLRTIPKNPRVRKICVRNSGAGNGCANFMDTWKNAFFLQENLHVHKIPRFGGGGELGLGGGRECRFYFYGRGDFSQNNALVLLWCSTRLLFLQNSLRATRIERGQGC